MVAQPSETRICIDGPVALIATLIFDGIGMEIDDFTRSRLFEPLGTTEFERVRGDDGVPSAASRLRLTAIDLAKIGVMIAGNGH